MAKPTNSTFKYICDKIAAVSRQRPAATDAIFSDDTQLPTSYVLIKNFVDIASRLAVMRMNERFLTREFQIILNPGIGYPYPLDDSVSAEGLIYHSFRNTTTGYARFLTAWNAGEDDSYIAFRRFYPDLTTIPTGSPLNYIVVAQQAGETNTANLLIYPTPDQTYTLQYQAKLDPIELLNPEDIIQWPKIYEVTLIMFAKSLFDNEIGVQSSDTIATLAEQAVGAVKAWASGPMEGRARQRQSVRFRGGRAPYGRFDFNNTAGW